MKGSVGNVLVSRIMDDAGAPVPASVPGGFTVRLGGRELWSREQVLAALVLGVNVVTMREVPAGGYVRGEDVRLVTVGDELYVRTDGSGVVGTTWATCPGEGDAQKLE